MESEIALARKKLDERGINYRSKNGDALIHLCADANAPMVHECVTLKQNINLQNFDGDTALHLAIRKGNIEVVNSLLMCGADPNIRNKLGQTPADIAKCESISSLLQIYKPGLVQAVTKGDFPHLLKLVNRFCVNLFSIIKYHPSTGEEKSAFQIAEENANKNSTYARCYALLKEQQYLNKLFHGVLQEDLTTVQEMLNYDLHVNINKRYRETHGWTPITYAVAWRSESITHALITSGRCNLNIRVATDPLGTTTEPLYFKTLNEDCPVEIWRIVRDNMDPGQDSERDMHGNTGILRALQCGKSAEFIAELINWKNGICIAERNSHGQTPREVAAQLERLDVVEVIDNYICDHLNGEFLVQMPVLFYEKEHLTIKNRDGVDLETLVKQSGHQNDMQALMTYEAIQDYGLSLFKAVQEGDLKSTAKFNKSHYTDRNGFTALTRAIAFQQIRAAEILLIERPQLKLIPDNSNRYPLHYAYALPSGVSEEFVDLLLAQDTDDLERRVDKDGRLPVDYRSLKDTQEIQEMLTNIKTLDAFGNRVISEEDKMDDCQQAEPKNKMDDCQQAEAENCDSTKMSQLEGTPQDAEL